MRKHYPFKEIATCFFMQILLLIATSGYAQVNIVIPADAKILDVTKAPFNADKTGLKDPTAAIQAALVFYKIIICT